MTVHVLIVEDDDDFIEEVRNILDALPVRCASEVASSRDEAFARLDAGGFLDLVILDLKIPTVSGALDADPQHGHAVFNRIRTFAPGTPIFVLTGSPAEDFIPEMLENQQQIDIWSQGRKTGNILFLKKYKVNECPGILGPIVNAIERLSDVELDRGGIDLSLAEDRLIRIFAKKFQGVRCVVSSLGGGLSGARVIRLRVTDSQGVQVHDAVAKLAGLQVVRREGERYDNFMARLDPAATPRKLATLEFGAHSLAGVFFGLADGFEESAFDIARSGPERSQVVIDNVEAATARWVADVPETRRTIRQFRQRMLDDASLEAIRVTYGLDWIRNFEDREIQCRWACIHGDLHGFNILVSANETTVLIDYGDVDEGPASLDPVTLELSLLFHPDAADAADQWPTVDQAKAWGDLDTYLVDCPFPDFTRACRQWALRVAAGNRDVAAAAYGYLVRQLKYDDTNKELTLALLHGVRSFYDEST
jgi:CheY-like chemotaxis protein